MTEKLFYGREYETSFTASITDVREEKGETWLVLNRTLFYPEGGGQPCDLGQLVCSVEEETVRYDVCEVRERQEEILHKIVVPEGTRLPRVGTSVSGILDWDRRYDLMCQHSGEHVFSGLCHATYGYENVGFHLTPDNMAIDLSGEMSWEQALVMEKEVNAYLRSCKECEIGFPAPEELAVLPYRSKKELTGAIRIVTFPAADICACCGLHVRNTGEIGLCVVQSIQNWKGGVRITLCFGTRADRYLTMLREQNRSIGHLLSVRPYETGEAVEQLKCENDRRKGELAAMVREKLASLAERLIEEGGAKIGAILTDVPAEQMRYLLECLMKKGAKEAILFCPAENGGFRYAILDCIHDIRSTAKTVNTALDGRGGGRDNMAQGSVSADEDRIRAFIAK